MIVDSRRLAVLFTWCSLFVICQVSSAQNATASRPLRYRIHDAGQVREFEIAADEIHIGVPGRTGGKIERMSGGGNALESVRQRAAQVSREKAQFAELVLYPADEERTASNRRILTRRILVRLADGANGDAVASRHGLINRGAVGAGKGFFIFEAASTGGALEGAMNLRNAAEVISADPELARQQQKRLVPDDTFFPQQWHLKNTGQGAGLAGIDVNVSATWDSYRGTGIRVGIVDDGMQLTHPDLLAAVDQVNDQDWNDLSPDDPSPDVFYDFHGTSCAGVAAGRGGNGIGISGAAPDATLVGLRLIAAPTVDSDEADAITWASDLIHVKSNSWGPSDDARTLEGPGPLTTLAFEQAATQGRGGLGTILVWAGGNGGDLGDNANYDGYANSIYTIAVGAVGNDGKRAYYSEPGANLVVAAPSSGGKLGIVTTDLVANSGYNTSTVSGELSDRDYTNDFGGTSSAAPLAAGCTALMLQANPALGWRDVQEILIRTARKVDPAHPDWINNAAGFHFNHDFGAGLLDADAAVTLAKTWTALAESSTLVASQSGLSIAIPDNNPTGITRTLDLTASNLRAEHVTVKVGIQHASRGQLAITLISPSGTQSRLAEKHADVGDNYSGWTFSTVRNWGEDAQGIWTLKVCDLTGSTTGKLTDVTLTVYGTPAPPVNQPPVITAAGISHGFRAFDDETLAVQGITATDQDDDPITFAFQWQTSVDNATFTPIAGATASAFSTAGFAGSVLRCQVTPSAAGKTGAPYFTASVAIDRRPPSFARHGVPFAYDSEIFLASQASSFSRPVILNEFSQGASGSKEWIELLVLKTADLRGYTLGDRGGTYVTFSQNSAWGAVAAGTVVVIYNANDRDTVLPPDDLDPAGHVMIIPHKNTTFFSGTSSWGGLTNSSPESILFKNPDGQIVDALSLNSENVYDPKLGTVSATKAAYYTGNTEIGADDKAQWTIASVTSATPAAANGAANTQFITDLRSGVLNAPPKFRLAAGSDSIPGITLDATTGLLSGTPSVPAGGFFNIVIERFTNAEIAAQAFTLVVAAADGSTVIPAGKTWSLLNDVSLPGSLSVFGSVDTAGHSIAVSGTIAVKPDGAVVNGSGTIAYTHLTGATVLPGNTLLIADPLNDLADPDGDRLSNLVEFAMGTAPSVPDASTLLRGARVDGYAEYKIRFPAGAGGVTRSIEVSDDLLTWRSGPEATAILSDNTGSDGYREVTVRDLVTGPRRFARIRISR